MLHIIIRTIVIDLQEKYMVTTLKGSEYLALSLFYWPITDTEKEEEIVLLKPLQLGGFFRLGLVHFEKTIVTSDTRLLFRLTM